MIFAPTKELTDALTELEAAEARTEKAREKIVAADQKEAATIEDRARLLMEEYRKTQLFHEFNLKLKEEVSKQVAAALAESAAEEALTT